MPLDIQNILQAILAEYALPWDGDHGVAHWARVYENGHCLAGETGANLQVVSLFAVFHDSRRHNEGTDPEHGQRGADFAKRLRGDKFQIDDAAFELLYRACAGHTHEHTHADATIQTCWDADRLDLGRVGITPCPDKLCSTVARQKRMIEWADERARCDRIPAFVRDKWNIDLGRLER